MRILLPWGITDTQKEHIRKKLARIFIVIVIIELLRFLLHEPELLLVKQIKIDIFLLGLKMTAIAYMRNEVHTNLKE